MVLAKPVVDLNHRGDIYVRLTPARRHTGGFKPRCTPPIEGSRWWFYNWCEDCFYDDRDGLIYPRAPHSIYVLKEGGISTLCKRECEEFDYLIYSPCKYVFGGRWLYWSPVGPPVRAPGAGSLTGAELP
ncbi:MAG: hypothetical protein QXP31_11940, partial [Pyrobaculum sp.]